MTPFAWSGLIAGIFSSILAIVVWIKGDNRSVVRPWMLFSITSTIWGFGVFWIGTSTTPEAALAAWRTTFALGVIWMPPVFFQFICAFCGISRPRTLIINYIVSVFFALVSFSGIFMESARPIFYPLHFTSPGILFPYFVAWWILSILYCHVELINVFRTITDQRRKNQIKYVFLATALGYSGGSLVYLPHFGIPIYPYGNFTVFIYTIIMSYAIVRYNLMDIRVFVRRTALLLFVYASLLLVSGFLLAAIHTKRSIVPFSSFQLTETLAIGLILSTGPFLYAYFVKRSSYFQEYTLAGLTHELKSPLAIIESAIEVLNGAPTDISRDPAKMSEYLQMIQRNSERLSLFVNDLLHAFKHQGNDFLLTKENAELVELCQKAIESKRHLAASKRVELKLSAQVSPIELAFDPIKVEQVVSNLLSNAIKFTNDGIVTTNLELKGKDVLISVTDTGIGISAEDLPYIFDRFYQGEKGRGQKGSGIGLTIAKMWVEAHGGKIWAESEGEGKGARVTFTLPLS